VGVGYRGGRVLEGLVTGCRGGDAECDKARGARSSVVARIFTGRGGGVGGCNETTEEVEAAGDGMERTSATGSALKWVRRPL